jgi:hypothetical protein
MAKKITWQEAADAIENLDDCARMTIGINASGPRELLYRYLEQVKHDAAPTAEKAERPAVDARCPHGIRSIYHCDDCAVIAFFREKAMIKPIIRQRWNPKPKKLFWYIDIGGFYWRDLSQAEKRLTWKAIKFVNKLNKAKGQNEYERLFS